MTTTRTGACYFASTGLDLRQLDRPDEQPRDIFIEDVCYRKVDPEYFAWLRHQMEAAKKRFETGQLPKAAWGELRGRFNKLQEWAIGHYGRESLKTAVRELIPSTYAPPVNRQPEPHIFPKTGDWKLSQPVSPKAICKVDAIREEAQAKGWSEARLYQNRGRITFPCGQDWGLVCFLGPGDALGKITKTHIEIIHDCGGRKSSLRFANSDVFPPRIPRKGAAA